MDRLLFALVLHLPDFARAHTSMSRNIIQISSPIAGKVHGRFFTVRLTIAFRTFSFCQFNAYDDEVHVVVAQEGHVEDAVETPPLSRSLPVKAACREPSARPSPVERKESFLLSLGKSPLLFWTLP